MTKIPFSGGVRGLAAHSSPLIGGLQVFSPVIGWFGGSGGFPLVYQSQGFKFKSNPNHSGEGRETPRLCRLRLLPLRARAAGLGHVPPKNPMLRGCSNQLCKYNHGYLGNRGDSPLAYNLLTPLLNIQAAPFLQYQPARVSPYLAYNLPPLRFVEHPSCSSCGMPTGAVSPPS